MITLKDIKELPEKFYSTKQVADALLISSNTVNGWIKNGHLQAMMVGNYYIIKGSDVISYLSKFNE